MKNHDSDHDHDCGCDDCPEVYDYVIVGAGTAGAPLAKLLSDDPCVSVFVIECGPDTRTNANVLNTIVPVLFSEPDLAICYPSDFSPLPSPFAPFFVGCLPEACGLGGDSLHNFLLAVHGTPCVYDEWAKRSGCAQWRYENLLPAMRYIEKYTPLATGFLNPEERGTKGPLFITQNPTAVDQQSRIVQAFASRGVPYSRDYNDWTQGPFVLGEGQFYTEPTTFERSWAASAFLNESVVTTGEGDRLVGVGERQLTIELNALAERVLFDDEVDADCWSVADHRPKHRRDKDRRHGRDPHVMVPDDKVLVPVEDRDPCSPEARRRARGVRYLKNGEAREVIARRKVILSAGAIGDVGVLVRSGIGPIETLRRLGIEPRVCNENVGRNMQDHYGPFVVMATEPGREQAFTGFFRGPESEEDGCRDFQISAQVNSQQSGQGVAAVLVFILNPAPIGTIDVLSTNVDPNALFIDFHFMEDPRDVAAIVRALKELGRVSIANTGTLPILPPAAFYPAAEFATWGGAADDDQLLIQYAREAGLASNHTSGTVRMAQCPEDGVVDENLDVFSVDNLGIADNGVVPRIIDGNTAWSAYVVGVAKAAIERAPVPFCFDPSCDDEGCDEDDHHDHDHNH